MLATQARPTAPIKRPTVPPPPPPAPPRPKDWPQKGAEGAPKVTTSPTPNSVRVVAKSPNEPEESKESKFGSSLESKREMMKARFKMMGGHNCVGIISDGELEELFSSEEIQELKVEKGQGRFAKGAESKNPTAAGSGRGLVSSSGVNSNGATASFSRSSKVPPVSLPWLGELQAKLAKLGAGKVGSPASDPRKPTEFNRPQNPRETQEIRNSKTTGFVPSRKLPEGKNLVPVLLGTPWPKSQVRRLDLHASATPPVAFSKSPFRATQNGNGNVKENGVVAASVKRFHHYNDTQNALSTPLTQSKRSASLSALNQGKLEVASGNNELI